MNKIRSTIGVIVQTAGWFGIIVSTITLCLIAILIGVIIADAPPHVRYKRVYDDCIVSEMLAAETCHEIALEALY